MKGAWLVEIIDARLVLLALRHTVHLITTSLRWAFLFQGQKTFGITVLRYY